jgi:hypothetical protein
VKITNQLLISLFDSALFHLADYFTRQLNFNRADFRHGKFVFRNTETALRVTKTVKEVLSFEARKASLNALLNATKKALKTLFQSLQNILANLTVNVFVFGIRFFDFFKLIGLVVVIQRNLIQPVGISALLKCGIIQISTQIECSFKAFLNYFRGFRDAKLEIFSYDLINNFHYFRNDCLEGESAISVACSPVFNYTKHFSFLQSRILFTPKKHRLKNADDVERTTSTTKSQSRL